MFDQFASERAAPESYQVVGAYQKLEIYIQVKEAVDPGRSSVGRLLAHEAPHVLVFFKDRSACLNSFDRMKPRIVEH